MKTLFAFFSMLAIIMSCAQTKSLQISKSDGYFLVAASGIIPSHEAGEAALSGNDTAYILYLQTPDTLPATAQAFVGNRAYRVQAVQVAEKSLQIGFSKTTGKAIRLSRLPKQNLYHLTLELTQNPASSKTSVSKGNVLLQGTQKGKPFAFVVSRLTELQAPLYQ